MFNSKKPKRKKEYSKKITKRQRKRKEDIKLKKKPKKKSKAKAKYTKKLIRNELNNLDKPTTKLEKMNLVDYLNNLDYNENKNLDLQLKIYLDKQRIAEAKAKSKRIKNELDLERFLTIEERKKKALKKEKELEKYLKNEEYANNLNLDLREYASLAKPIELRLDKNPRVYFVNAHSIACPTQPIELRLFSRFSRLEKFRLLQMQSLGRLNTSIVTILLAKLLELYPEFYEYFISLETDGDVEKFKKLFAEYAFRSTDESFLKYKTGAITYKTKYIADFEIYPKPKNPELQQVPFTKRYHFYPSDVMEKYPRGIFEVTRLNTETGFFEMDPFLFSEELYNIFLEQKKRAKKSDSMLEIIKCSLLIPDEQTVEVILKFGGEEYLERINKLNKINRHYFESIILKSTKSDLREESYSIFNVMNKILFEVEEDTPDNEILVLDNSCNSFPVLEKDKTKDYSLEFLNQFEDPKLTKEFKNTIKKYKPKRSKSRELEINEP